MNINDLNGVFYPIDNPLFDSMVQSQELQNTINQDLSSEAKESLLQITDTLMQQTEEIRNKINERLEEYLLTLPPDVPDEIRMLNMMMIIHAEIDLYMEDPQTAKKLESMEKAKHLHESVETVETGLKTAMVLLAVGINLGEKWEHHFNPNFLNSVEAINLELSALEFINTGMSCFFAQKQAKYIRSMEQQLEGLSQVLQSVPSDQTRDELQLKFDSLEKEINQAKQELNTNIGKALYTFSSHFLKTSAETLEVIRAAPVIEANVKILSHLLIAADSLSLAGSLLALGWNSYQIVSHSKKLLSTQTKIRHLEDLYAQPATDPLVKSIIHAKIDRLKNVRRSHIATLGLKTLSTGSNSLAIAAGTVSLVAASGVVISASAATFLTVTGGIGIGVSAAVVGVPIAIALYQKRYDLEHLSKATLYNSEKIIREAELKFAKRLTHNINSSLQQLEKEQNTIQRALNNRLDSLPSVNSSQQTVMREMKKLEKQQQKDYRQLSKEIMPKVEELSQKIETIKQKKEQMMQRIDHLQHKKQESAGLKDLKNLARKFRKLNREDLKNLQETIQNGINTKDVKRKVELFLLSQDFPATDLTVQKVLSYITSDK